MFKILGCYRPREYDLRRIGEDLLSFTRNMGLESIEIPWCDNPVWQDTSDHSMGYGRTVDVRGPDWCSSILGDYRNVRAWHQDGHESNGKPMALVLWASALPTEFLLPGNRRIIRPEPYEIVIADNLKVKHRMPKVTGKGRWFFRQAVQLPEWLQDIGNGMAIKWDGNQIE